jgi:hypothetical protein
LAVILDPATGLPTTKKTKAAGYAPLSFSAATPVYGMNMPADPGAPVTSYGGITLPGLDYKPLIESDPFFLQATGDLTKQGIQSAAQRALARQRALIQFGSIPDFGAAGMDLGLVGGDIQADITPETVTAAAANNEAGLSTTARIGKAHSDAVRQIQNALTARGLARSGETGYQLDQENQNYAIGTNDATGKLLDYLAGVQAAFTQGEADRANAKNAAAAQSAQTQATEHPYYGPQDLSWDYTESAWGPDASGNYYIPAPDWTAENKHYVVRPKKTEPTPTPTPTPTPAPTKVAYTPMPVLPGVPDTPPPGWTQQPTTGITKTGQPPAPSINNLWRMLSGA